MIKNICKQLSAFKRLIVNPTSFQSNAKIINWAAKTPQRSSFYYFYFSRKFSREQQSVLCGIKSHITHDDNSLAIVSNLRRNLHRIEKGLTTYTLKPVFGKEYILETVLLLQKFSENYNDECTIRWAIDVLTKYFSVVTKENEIASAEEQFVELKNQQSLIKQSSGENYCGPYKQKEINSSSITHEDFMNLCHQRHSIRWYEQKSVPVNMVEQAIDSALLAPSACNRQPFRFVLIKSSEKLEHALKIPNGCATFSNNITLLVALIGDLSAYFDERDRHLIYIDGGLAAMNFMLSLETMGLSSCPINWPDLDEKKEAASTLFNMKIHEQGIMFFSVGYPLMNGGVAFSARKQMNQVTTII
ncbi:MAG: nitroreductase [Desulforhopalus sp.]|jgi:nitroreductase